MEISSAFSASIQSTVAPSAASAESDSGSTVNTPSNTVAPSTKTPNAGGRTAATADEQAATKQQQQQQEIRELASRDREVRNHEQAHAAAGGAHAGSPQYEFTTGSNGVSYATGGHVNIDVSDVPGDTQATITKMQAVQRAALAPAQPSAQDRVVAAEASARASEARSELRAERAARQENPSHVDHESGTKNSGRTEGLPSVDNSESSDSLPREESFRTNTQISVYQSAQSEVAARAGEPAAGSTVDSYI